MPCSPDSPANQRLREIMSDPVLGLSAQCLAGEALRIARDTGVHHFPVVEDNRLVGFVCTCDLEETSPDSRIGERMHTPVIEISASATREEAARVMNEHGVGALLVRDVRGIRGIVTRRDLADAGERPGLFPEHTCAVCGARHHLRAGPDGLHVCVDCRSRTDRGNWLEIAPGD
jgi:CBS domain-containing protein